MKIPSRIIKICIWICIIAPLTAQSEELLGSVGVTDTDDHNGASYGWQLAFSKSFSRRLSGSLGWINEGHLQDHHRDGASAQLWIKGFEWREQIALAIGIGPYVYFDTQPSSAIRGYNDFHGVGEILSASTTLRMSNPWSLHMDFNIIHTPGHSSTRSVLFGAGYHFDNILHDITQSMKRDSTPEPENKIQLFGGKVITNSLDSQETQTFGVDYRSEFVSWAAWSATWFYRPEGQNGQHNRIAGELWLVNHCNSQRLSLSAGLGAYARLGSRRDDIDDLPTIDGLFSLRGDWQWTQHVGLVLTGYRRFTRDDLDRDMLVMGISWRFGTR